MQQLFLIFYKIFLKIFPDQVLEDENITSN